VLHYAIRPLEEPRPDWPDARLREELVKVYGDATWVKPDRLLKEVRDPANPWDEVLRFWFNVRTAGVSRAVDPRVWDSLAFPREVLKGTYVGLGFDGSEYRDSTVLRGCTREGYTFVLGVWARPPGELEWRVPVSEVMQRIHEVFAYYSVGRMYADPPRWETEIEALQERYNTKDNEVVLPKDTNQPSRMTPIVDRWLTAVRRAGAMLREHDGYEGPLFLPYSHDGDEFTSEQVKATRLRKVRLTDIEDDRTMYMFEKDGRVGNDATVADSLAYEAAMTMPELAPRPKPAILFGRSR
jgi:hypothetical protein